MSFAPWWQHSVLCPSSALPLRGRRCLTRKAPTSSWPSSQRSPSGRRNLQGHPEIPRLRGHARRRGVRAALQVDLLATHRHQLRRGTQGARFRRQLHGCRRPRSGVLRLGTGGRPGFMASGHRRRGLSAAIRALPTPSTPASTASPRLSQVRPYLREP